MSLRALTFNIRAGRNLAGELNLARTAEVIAAADADVVGLQEVDRQFGERSAWVDQMAALSEQLGWHGEFAPALDRGAGQYGIAILTPYEIRSFTGHRLGNQGTDPTVETRAAAHAEIAIGSRTVQVVNTHLEVRDRTERRHQAAQVRAVFDATSGPGLVMGDFNARCAQVPMLTAGLVSSGDRRTQPSRWPWRRIDHVLGRELSLVRTRVLDVQVSDHRPVWTEWAW